MNDPLLPPILQSIFFAVFVGFVVSLDVIGLIASQWRDFNIDPKTSRSIKTPWKQSASHASMHSVLFLIYIIFVAYIIYYTNIAFSIITPLIVKIIPDIEIFIWIKNIQIDAEFLALASKATLIIFSITIIMFVWFTYRGKLFEDHSKKSIDPANSLRIDVKAIYYMIELFVPRYANLLNLALTLAVAVDMLAVSAIIRVRFKSVNQESGAIIGADTGYKGTHVEFTGSAITDVFIFSLFIFTMVFLFAYCMAKFVKNRTSSPSISTIMGFRLAESILIFAILFRTLPHLIGSSDIGTYVADFAEYFSMLVDSIIFGILMTLTLIFSKGFNGLEDMRSSIRKGLTKPRVPVGPIQSRWLGVPFTERLKVFGRFLQYLVPPILLSILGLTFAFLLIATSISVDPINQMKSLVEILYTCIAVCTGLFLFLYIPILSQFRLSMILKPEPITITGISIFDGIANFIIRMSVRIINILSTIINCIVTILSRLGEIEIRTNIRFFRKKSKFLNGAMIFIAYWLVIVGMHYIYTGRIDILLSNNPAPHLEGLLRAGIFPITIFCLFKYRTLRQEKSKIALGNAGRGGHYHEDIGEFLKATAVVCLAWKFGVVYFGL